MSNRRYNKVVDDSSESDSFDSVGDRAAPNGGGSGSINDDGYRIDNESEELLNPVEDLLAKAETYERPLTPGGAAFNVATCAIGAGVLALPAALDDSGWIGLLLLFILAMASAYTAVLIGRCQYVSGKLEDERVDFQTYGEIGYAAAGNVGKYFTAIQVYLTLVGVGSIFVVLSLGFVQDLREQFSDGEQFSDFEAAMVILPFMWLHVWVRDFKMLGNLASLSIAVTLYMEIAVMVQLLGFTDYRCSSDPECSYITANGDLSLLLAVVTFAFAFGAHPVLPTIGARMDGYHKKFAPVMWGTFSFMAAAYIPFAAVCYWVFGSNAQAPILENLDDGFVKTSSVLAILLNVVISYPVVLKAVEDALEQALRIAPENSWRCIVQRALARTVLVALTFVIGLSIPDFGLILNLVAAVTNTFTMFILPATFYLLLHWKSLRSGSWRSKLEIPLCFVIILFGFTACGLGTYESIDAIVSSRSD